MNLQEFIQKYENKLVDVYGNISTNFVASNPRDDYNGDYQCVDLIKAYVRDLFDISGSFGHARNYTRNLANRHPDKFDFIANDKNKTVKIGDIVSIDTGNAYGHIGIVVDVGNGGFEIIDQNGEKTSHGYGRYIDRVRRRRYSYGAIIGWARPKNANNPLSRKNVANRIFDTLCRQSTPKTADDIWNGQNPNQVASRYEVVAMIKNYFSRIENRTIAEEKIWNASRPNDSVSEYELSIMIERAINL